MLSLMRKSQLSALYANHNSLPTINEKRFWIKTIHSRVTPAEGLVKRIKRTKVCSGKSPRDEFNKAGAWDEKTFSVFCFPFEGWKKSLQWNKVDKAAASWDYEIYHFSKRHRRGGVRNKFYEFPLLKCALRVHVSPGGMLTLLYLLINLVSFEWLP